MNVQNMKITLAVSK
nr:hypothetical protein [Ligilactobacillus ruminis]